MPTHSTGHYIPHKQVPAKVTAYVDEDIKELIEVLNTFDGLWTDESCQGYQGEKVEIIAYYGSMKDYDFITTARYTEHLISLIKESIEEIDNSLSISLEWAGDMRFPCIVIRCAKSAIECVTKVFYYGRKKFG